MNLSVAERLFCDLEQLDSSVFATCRVAGYRGSSQGGGIESRRPESSCGYSTGDSFEGRCGQEIKRYYGYIDMWMSVILRGMPRERTGTVGAVLFFMLLAASVDFWSSSARRAADLGLRFRMGLNPITQGRLQNFVSEKERGKPGARGSFPGEMFAVRVRARRNLYVLSRMALFYMVLHHDVNSPYQMLDAGFVYLEGNLLENLPDNLFVSLPVLKWLDVRNNKLTQFPKSVAYHDNLQVLLLQGNQIQRLPLELDWSSARATRATRPKDRTVSIFQARYSSWNSLVYRRWAVVVMRFLGAPFCGSPGAIASTLNPSLGPCYNISQSNQDTVQISMEVHCKVFPGYPISRFGDIAEPLRSPGLTGGHKERILVEVEAFQQETLHKVMSSFEEYIQQCIA
uniref:Uncharacterized protein n=1 Tax=Timema douglasi TaxID=61478 RepID=A0A7R8VNI9_TIMDO|nr:unnamed protein product [Timema douglasi]